MLCDGVEIFEAAAFFDVLGWASEYGDQVIEVVTAGVKREVRCTFGLRVVPDEVIGDLRAEDFDALAVPGGFGEYGFYDEGFSEPVARLIRGFHDLDRPIAAICVGALPVAASGVLAGRRATTYQRLGGGRRQQLADFGAEVEPGPVVRDDGIITSTGPATAPEVAFLLLEELTTPGNAERIRELMGFDGETHGGAGPRLVGGGGR